MYLKIIGGVAAWAWVLYGHTVIGLQIVATLRGHTMSKHTMLIVSVAAIALAAGTGRFALAQQASPEVLGELADNQGIFVDGKTFKIVRGAAKGNPTAKIAKMGAKEIGPGAILFRHGDKLYGVEGGAPEMSAQAMKNFQDNWNVSYMKAMTQL